MKKLNYVTERNTERKFKKVRWNRVFIALFLLFCITYTIIHITTSFIQAIPEFVEKQDELFVQNVLNQYDTIEVTMYNGETVWEKQQKLIPSSDYNMYDILYVLSHINGGYDDWHQVRVGDKFIFLTEKESDSIANEVASN